MKKKDGFPGQLSYVIPEKIVDMVRNNPLIGDLYITDIGYYPQARHHFREREKGVAQVILLYNIGGRGVIKTGDQTAELPPDHFFIIPRHVPHTYVSDKHDPWSIYWIHFTGSKSGLFARHALKPIPIERGKTSRTHDRIELFSEIFRNLEQGFSMENLEYINLCLNYLLATFIHIRPFRLIRQGVEKDPVAQSINFMLENLTRSFKLSELSNLVNLSGSHFSHLFKEKTGYAPIDYFIQLKIQRACRLLDNTNWTISEVAAEIGFNDQFYFTRQFGKIMNMSPRKYRRRYE